MAPAAATRSTGQPAFSNPKAISDFISRNFQLAGYNLEAVSQSESWGTLTKAAGNSSRTENSFTARNARLSATQTAA